MAVSLSPVHEAKAESTLLEMNQELRSQLAQCKQDLRDLKEQLLISEATAYFLANQLQKSKSEGCRDIIESILGEKLQCEEKLADQTGLMEQLNRMQKKLQDGWDVSCLLHQSIHVLLNTDIDTIRGQALRQKIMEIQRLVEHVITQLSPENNEEDHLAKETLNQAKQGSDTHPDKREEEQFYASSSSSPPESMMVNINLSDEDNEDAEYRLDEVYLLPSDNYDLSLPYKPCKYQRDTCYEREDFSSVNTQEVTFEVIVSTLSLDPSPEFVDLFASKSTCQVSDESIAFGSIKEKIMERKRLFRNWRLACRFPGLHT